MLLKSLRVKLTFYVTFLIFLVALPLLFFSLYSTNYWAEKELEEFGFHLTKDLSSVTLLGIAPEDPVLFQKYLQDFFGEKSVVLVTVYNQQGDIISSKKRIEIEEKITTDILNELSAKKETIKRFSYTKSREKFFDFYSPVFKKDSKELIGFVRVGLSLEKIKERNKEAIIFDLSITIPFFLLGIFILFILTNKLLKPIGSLKRGTEIIGGGEFGHRINIKTGDELEDLAKSFNQMAEKLSQSHTELQEARSVLEIKVDARTKALQELTKSLDEQIKKRTKELRERINELEKFQELTVGRELKMIKLKKETRELKKELEKIKSQENKEKIN